MALFLLLFLLIYGGMHLQFFFRIASAFAAGGIFRVFLIFFLLAGLMAPIAMRVAEDRGYETTSRLLSIAGYYWMAFLLLFFFVSILMEFYHGILTVASNRFHCPCRSFIPSSSLRFLIPATLGILLTIYGSFEAQRLKTEHLFIHSEKIPKEAGVIRIVQISDVHIGGALGSTHVPAIIRAVQDASPDILVSTGDLVDGRGAYVAEAARMFQEIRPKWGKFAVTGNHEFYLGLNSALKFLHTAGFVPLRNRSVCVADGALCLIGADDVGTIGMAKNGTSDGELLSVTDRKRFTVFLKHRPVVDGSAVGFFDLQLSGHTHKGQIFPFSIVTRWAFPYHAGDYGLPGGALLHVSRGTGIWGPPVRLFAPPEITVIDLMSR